MRVVRALFGVLAAILLMMFQANAQTTGFDPSTGMFVHIQPRQSQPQASTLAATSADSFGGFVRYPAEDRFFIGMTGVLPTAYFRDVFTGGQTFHDGAADGDTIHADMLNPNGTVIGTWTPFTFHSSYTVNGEPRQNCWVGFGIVACDSTAIEVIWYRQSQCGDGGFTMRFYHNNAKFAEGSFKILPQIEESRIQNYNQGGYSGAGNEYNHQCRSVDADGNILNVRESHTCSDPLASDEAPFYISAKGCFLTDAAHLMSYHGAAVDPPTLNNALKAMTGENGGAIGYQNHNVHPDGLRTYAEQRGIRLDRRASNVAKTDLAGQVCSYGPQLMGVHCRRNPETTQLVAGHWVTVFGQKEDKSAWLVHDPDGGDSTMVTDAEFCESRIFSGPEHTFVTQTGVEISFHSPVELLITDPLGRRLGGDPVAHAYYEEIPNATYESIGIEDAETKLLEDDPIKSLYLPGASTGQYVLKVTGAAGGSYNANFVTKDTNGVRSETELKNVPIALNEVQTFTLNYDSTPGVPMNLTGGFAGGGQRPRDVNRFLSFARPSESHIFLPANTRATTVVVFYSAEIIPGTFTANLNGASVTSLFHPQPSSSESVTLPLQPGRNVLDLQIDGNLPNRVATDSDRLVFSVQ